MRDADRISGFLAGRIDHISDRPLMYCGTAEGVDLLLHTYHELRALIHDRASDYQDVARAVHVAEGCGVVGFARCFRADHPYAAEADVARYVVDRWREIGASLARPS